MLKQLLRGVPIESLLSSMEGLCDVELVVDILHPLDTTGLLDVVHKPLDDAHH